MASSRATPLPPWMTGELPQPEDEAGIGRTFAGYREALRRMSIPELIAETTRLSSLLEQQARDRLEQMVRSSESSSSIDRIVPRTTPLPSTAERSPRGQAALASPSPRPDPLTRLSSPRGRALAAKLLAANARSVAGRRIR